jgi:Domain of unknown function (DUF4331)
MSSTDSPARRPRRERPHVALAALAALALAGFGCSDDTGPLGDGRMFNQVQRLGNPLVSEVFLAKRNHPLHGSIGPSADTVLAPELKAFVATVAGRSATVQSTLATVLLPDMLIVQTDKDPASAGWLTWALADGWGGRKLDDDVVDAGLSAIFGPLLDPNGVSPGLATDNVASDSPFSGTFPYLGTPN